MLNIFLNDSLHLGGLGVAKNLPILGDATRAMAAISALDLLLGELSFTPPKSRGDGVELLC